MGDNYFGLTDVGSQRANNEDRFIAKTVVNGQFVVAAVIDGVGGYEGGEIAAEITSEEITKGLDRIHRDLINRMIAVLDNANERIIREKEKSAKNNRMACVVTLAVIDMERNIFYFAHVGDTRLYLFRDGSLIKVTRDHSAVGFLEESGRLTEEAAMQHPKRNEVNKVLGYETQIALTKGFIDTGESPFLPGDIILLCSDGLTDMIPSREIISLLSDQKIDLQVKARHLIDAANQAGGRDNITVVLVHNNKSPLQHSATRPLIIQKENGSNGYGQTKVKAGGSPQQNKPKAEKKSKKNKSNALRLLVTIFCFGLIWLLYREYKKPAPISEPLPMLKKSKNKQELDLQDSLNASPNGIVNIKAGQTITVTDTLFIKKDSLHIIGNGISFLRDSSYSGPAFILPSTCKYFFLDSVTIENFNTGILVTDKGLQLKKVLFKNCLVPVQFRLLILPNTPVSGTQAKSIFNFTDSLHKN